MIVMMMMTVMFLIIVYSEDYYDVDYDDEVMFLLIVYDEDDGDNDAVSCRQLLMLGANSYVIP